jgi:hypothetical protein
MKKVTEGLPEGNQAMATLLIVKTPAQKTVHAPTGPKVCKGFDCRNEFTPNRKNQVFCSSKCRLSYFATAREIGIFFLERINCNPTLKVFIEKLLKTKDIDEIPIEISKKRGLENKPKQ